MMYDDLIKQLRYCADATTCRHCLWRSECCPHNAQRQAADAIEELEKDLERSKGFEAFWQHEAEEALRKYQVAIGSKPQWISVTERLPKERINPNTRDFEYVLCVTIWCDVRPFKYGTPIGQKEAHFWNGNGYVDAYVTHWMPLPEPPKEET